MCHLFGQLPTFAWLEIPWFHDETVIFHASAPIRWGHRQQGVQHLVAGRNWGDLRSLELTSNAISSAEQMGNAGNIRGYTGGIGRIDVMI